MEFIKPKPVAQGTKATWKLSQRTRAVVRYYAEYTGYTEDEIVDQFLYQLCENPEFQNCLKQKHAIKIKNRPFSGSPQSLQLTECRPSPLLY